MLGYEYPQTLEQVRTTLANKLHDPLMVFYSEDELNFYLREALETWSLYSRFFKVRASLNVGANVQLTNIYSCESSDEDGNVFYPLENYQFSVHRPLKSILLHLMETQDTDALPTLTGHISQDQLASYLSLAISRFSQESQAIIYRTPLATTTAIGQDRHYIPNYVNDIVRLELRDVDGTIYNVQKITKSDLDKLYPSLHNKTGLPKYFTISNTPTLSIDFFPRPGDIYTIDLFHTRMPTPLTNTIFTNDTTLLLPNFWWPAIKFLTLFYLYSFDGPMKHPQLADYCKSRYETLVLMARTFHPIDQAYYNDTPLSITSVSELDQLDIRWRKTTTSLPPKSIALLGQNMLFLRRKSSTPITLTFDLTSIPIFPASNTSLFPVGEDYLSYVLDYAQHLATLKCGGAEFTSTLPLYYNFLRGAARVNDKLNLHLILPSIESERSMRPSRKQNDYSGLTIIQQEGDNNANSNN